MAVLNIRVDDQVRDQLKDMADEEGITVSEYVRNLVMAAIVPGTSQKKIKATYRRRRACASPTDRCSRYSTGFWRTWCPRTTTRLTRAPN